MSDIHDSAFSIRGDAKHSARLSQQGQGYQVNIDQIFVGSRPPLDSPWLEQFESWPLVREIDPLELGVHRSSINQGSAVPLYVERDVDSETRDKLSRICRRGGLLTLVGDSTAGKTRLAYESVLATAPTRSLFRPHSRIDLRDSLVTLISHRHESILWLDDLEHYIGPDGLTSTAVSYLKRAGVAIVATIRGEQYRRFLSVATEQVHQDNLAVSDFRRILDQSQSVLVSRLWSSDEIARAAKSGDQRVLEAVDHSNSFGVAEYLAAGPLLLDEWSIAWGAEANPRGASLIAAAVDCARAGIDVPIPRDLLVSLHYVYLDKAGGELLRPEAVDQAFSWAAQRRSGVASPLIPTNAGKDYRAFDYLVDSLMRKEPVQEIPNLVWSSVLEFARSNRRLLMGVASAAHRHSVLEIEIASWTALVETGDPRGAMSLGSIFEVVDEFDTALEWYKKAAAMGEADGWTFAGLLYGRRKDLSSAERYFRRAAEADCIHGMNHLALFLRAQGNVKEAESWFREALMRTQQDDLSLNLAKLLFETDRFDEAEAIYRKAVESGQSEVLNELGILLAKSGKKDEARLLWLDGVEKGVANAAAQLALDLESSGKFGAAEGWWRRAIDLGSESAIISLAIMLDTSVKSRRNDAEELFRQALDLDVDDAAYSYSIFLLRQHRLDEAEVWAREAVENQVENASYLLASILEERGDSQEGVAVWWEHAARDGHRVAQARIGEYLSDKGDLEDAQRWLTLAAEAGNEQAACQLGWVHQCLGNRAEAEMRYAASFEAGHAHAACQHGSLLLMHNETDAAIERYRAAYHAGHAHTAEFLEKIYREAGRGREAAEWMRRAKEGPPRSGRKNTKKSKRRKRRKRY
jgi:hypothetical protein